MKREDVFEFEKLVAQAQSIHREISILSKKSPNDAVNTFKLKFINATLEGLNSILKDKHTPFRDFSAFSADDVPSNSDVCFVVDQYLECAENFRADNIEYRDYKWTWKLDKGQIGPETVEPKKTRLIGSS